MMKNQKQTERMKKIKKLKEDMCEIYGHDWVYSPSSYTLKNDDTVEIKESDYKTCERCGKHEDLRRYRRTEIEEEEMN